MIGTTTELRQHAVRRARPMDVATLAGRLARAFYHDPVVGHWCFADQSRRMRRLARGFELFLRKVYLRHDEVYTTESLNGGALWLPPGTWKMSNGEQLRMLPRMARIYGRELPRVLEVMSFLEARHPHEPHYYLQFIGVEPGSQGEGVGSALLEPILERCESEGLPAYLEATSERNRALYERNGFTVVEEANLPGSGPPIWPMWREPGR